MIHTNIIYCMQAMLSEGEEESLEALDLLYSASVRYLIPEPSSHAGEPLYSTYMQELYPDYAPAAEPSNAPFLDTNGAEEEFVYEEPPMEVAKVRRQRSKRRSKISLPSTDYVSSLLTVQVDFVPHNFSMGGIMRSMKKIPESFRATTDPISIVRDERARQHLIQRVVDIHDMPLAIVSTFQTSSNVLFNISSQEIISILEEEFPNFKIIRSDFNDTVICYINWNHI